MLFVRRCAAIVLVALACVAFAAPASAMTLYTSEVLPDVQTLILDAFQKEHPGMEVKVFRTGSGEVAAKVRAELEARNPQADAVVDVPIRLFFEFLAGRPGAAAEPPSRLRAIRSNYSYQDGAYHEVRLIYNVIAVNTRQLGSLPRPGDWRDLIKPEYRGTIAMPDPNYSGGPLALSARFMTKRYGFDFFVK